MRIHLHTFVTNPNTIEWDYTSELLRNVKQSFWDYYSQWGLSQPPQPLLQEQALHMVSADTNILVVTKTYALNRFREIIQNLRSPPWDIHEVFIGGDAGLAEVVTTMPYNNVYINWVGIERPNNWHFLPVHRWITFSKHLIDRPSSMSLNKAQHISVACSPVPDDFTSSLPSSDLPALDCQNMLLFMLATTDRPDGLKSDNIQNIARIILEQLAYKHVSIASLNSVISTNTLQHIYADNSGVDTSLVDSLPPITSGPNSLCSQSAVTTSTHPNTFDTFIRNARCSLILSAASLDCLSKVIGTMSIIDHRHRIFVVVPTGTTKKFRDYIHALHWQGYFNIVDLETQSNPLSMLADDSNNPQAKSSTLELFNTLCKDGISYPKLGFGPSACSMFKRICQNPGRIKPAMELRPHK